MIVRVESKAEKVTQKKQATLRVAGRDVTLSNLDKVMYPEVGFTKSQVIDYYTRVARYILPHLKDRPITMKRFPDGINGEYFYEKDAPSFTPDWIKTYPIPRTSEKSIINYILINDLPALVWSANMANLDVLSGNVIEHVRKIWVWIKEVARATKVGGLVITINPCSWPYHEIPVDCWRAYPEGMRALYDEARLEVLYLTWESLESVSSKRRLPGRSSEWQTPRLRLIDCWTSSAFLMNVPMTQSRLAENWRSSSRTPAQVSSGYND
jgi:hypothetical protein